MFKIIMSEILISINIFFKQEDIFRAKILCLTKKTRLFYSIHDRNKCIC